MERTKDKFINTKSTKKGMTKTGKEGLYLSFKQEDVVALIEELTKNVDNPRGAKLSIYTGQKTTNDGGREFDSTAVVVSGIQEFGANTGAAGQKFAVKKTTTLDASVEEKIKKLKG